MNNMVSRYKCASCDYVFDTNGYADCPKCGSNACDEQERPSR